VPGRWLRGRRSKIAPHKRPTKLRNGRIPQSISAPGRFVVTDRHTSLGQEPIFRWGLQGSGRLCWCCIRVRNNYDLPDCSMCHSITASQRCLNHFLGAASLLGWLLARLLAYVQYALTILLAIVHSLHVEGDGRRAMGGVRDAHQMPSVGVWGCVTI
jgi:hypothetical protein